MIYGTIYGENKNQALLTRVMRTACLFERMQGLLGRPALQAGEGLLISPCNSVHTAFMAYPIDLLFLGQDWTIRKMVHALRPWRMAYSWKASMVLELKPASIESLGLDTGTKLYWEENR